MHYKNFNYKWSVTVADYYVGFVFICVTIECLLKNIGQFLFKIQKFPHVLCKPPLSMVECSLKIPKLRECDFIPEIPDKYFCIFNHVMAVIK